MKVNPLVQRLILGGSVVLALTGCESAEAPIYSAPTTSDAADPARSAQSADAAAPAAPVVPTPTAAPQPPPPGPRGPTVTVTTTVNRDGSPPITVTEKVFPPPIIITETRTETQTTTVFPPGP